MNRDRSADGSPLLHHRPGRKRMPWDEALDEPARPLVKAWTAAALPEFRLSQFRPGETLTLP